MLVKGDTGALDTGVVSATSEADTNADHRGAV